MALSGCEKWGAKNAQALHWLHMGYPCVIPKFRNSRDTISGNNENIGNLWGNVQLFHVHPSISPSIIAAHGLVQELIDLNIRSILTHSQSDRGRLSFQVVDFNDIYGIFSSKLPHLRKYSEFMLANICVSLLERN